MRHFVTLSSRRLLRRASALLVAVAALLLAAPAALACGSGGYSYAGLSASSHAFGIEAVVTPVGGFDVLSGHVAGWVGVGGPGLGPRGTDEWLQVGFSGFPALTGNDIYYELMLPNGQPSYHQVATSLPFGQAAHVAVLEMNKHRDWWRVWVNGSPASSPIHMPASHGRWSPMATAESWDGGTAGACNGFLYRFDRLSVARAPGGSWQTLSRGYPIKNPTTAVQLLSAKGSFLAAEGELALRTLSSVSR